MEMDQTYWRPSRRDPWRSGLLVQLHALSPAFFWRRIVSDTQDVSQRAIVRIDLSGHRFRR
jgi:hypothetical protein